MFSLFVFSEVFSFNIIIFISSMNFGDGIGGEWLWRLGPSDADVGE